MSESDAGAGPPLTVAAVARRLGVAPATLRTWDRRYGLGPGVHAAGEHRRYAPADVARLVVMRRLVLDGVAPAEAARIALATTGDPGGPGLHLVGSGGSTAATPTAVVDAALRGREQEVRDLLALAPDADVADWWSGLVEPARQGLAVRTVLARAGEEPDLVVLAAATSALRERSAPLVRAHLAGRRVVLLAAAPGEARPLALHVLAGALADHGVDARIIVGPVGPARALEIVVMTHPAALVLMSHLTQPDLSVVATVAEAHPELPQFVWVVDEASGAVPLGRSVQRTRSFTGLLHEVLAVC